MRLILAALGKCARYAHCITYAACQALSLPGRVRLLDTSSPHYTLRMLYVGASRCTAASLLEGA